MHHRVVSQRFPGCSRGPLCAFHAGPVQRQQMLVAIRAVDGEMYTIGEAAGRLLAQHHAAVERVARIGRTGSSHDIVIKAISSIP